MFTTRASLGVSPSTLSVILSEAFPKRTAEAPTSSILYFCSLGSLSNDQ